MIYIKPKFTFYNLCNNINGGKLNMLDIKPKLNSNNLPETAK